MGRLVPTFGKGTPSTGRGIPCRLWTDPRPQPISWSSAACVWGPPPSTRDSLSLYADAHDMGPTRRQPDIRTQRGGSGNAQRLRHSAHGRCPPHQGHVPHGESLRPSYAPSFTRCPALAPGVWHVAPLVRTPSLSPSSLPAPPSSREMRCPCVLGSSSGSRTAAVGMHVPAHLRDGRQDAVTAQPASVDMQT